MNEIEKITHLFCLVDDFCNVFLPEYEKRLLSDGLKKRNRKSQMLPSEIITLFIFFHQLRFRDFKTFYTRYVACHLREEFPNLLSYNRFIQLLPRNLLAFCCLLFSLCQQADRSGIYFVDSMPLKVCHIKREKQHQVFRGIAQKSKSSMGWFFGFKLHLVINDKGQLLSFCLSAGNVDDRKPVPELTKQLQGRLFADRGYISTALFEELFARGLQLITRIKKNMKNALMPLIDKVMLRKRVLIECVNDQLKNISQIEHTRHRSPWNFLANLFAALLAYSFQPHKPSLSLPFALPAS